ncbi:sperm flagellar protein 1-like, partial [Corapipo altera]|uniref:sperm flagellar protein 1-like n=1 Tax=Corapipo altera TaxID=415028 RepID=UPI000FD62CFE
MADAAPALQALYRWLDTVPLSRPRRNIARDFSDGVLAAEVVKFFFPAMVELHSFVPASSTAQKLANWGHLNRYGRGTPLTPGPPFNPPPVPPTPGALCPS